MKRKKEKHKAMERTTGIPTSMFYSLEGLKQLITQCDDARTLEQLYRENRKRVDADAATMQTLESRRVMILLQVA